MGKLGKVLRDPVFQFVGALIALVALGFMIYQIFWQRPTTALRLTVLANTSLMNVDSTIRSDITVTYRGQPASNLTLVQLKLENSGTEPISAADYEVPITLTFAEPSQIVDAQVVETNPPNIPLRVEASGNTATLSPVLLNKGDAIIFRLIVLDLPFVPETSPEMQDHAPFGVQARIARVNQITLSRASEPSAMRTWAWTEMLASIATAGIMALLLYVLNRNFPRVLSATERVVRWLTPK